MDDNSLNDYWRELQTSEHQHQELTSGGSLGLYALFIDPVG